jgi:hypothetical protein
MLSTMVPKIYIKSYSNPLYLQRHIYVYYIIWHTNFMPFELHTHTHTLSLSLSLSHTHTHSHSHTHTHTQPSISTNFMPFERLSLSLSLFLSLSLTYTQHTEHIYELDAIRTSHTHTTHTTRTEHIYELHALRTSHTHTHIHKQTHTHRAYPRTSCPTLRGLRNERAVLGPDCSAPGHTHTHTQTHKHTHTHITLFFNLCYSRYSRYACYLHQPTQLTIYIYNYTHTYIYARPSLGFRV